MKSFKQYITERAYNPFLWWLLQEIGQEALEGFFNFEQTLNADDYPVVREPTLPPWHITHPDNGFDNPPPGWYRQGEGQWLFTPMPTDGGNYKWNPSNGTWKEIEGPPSPYADPDYIPYAPGTYQEEPDPFGNPGFPYNISPINLPPFRPPSDQPGNDPPTEPYNPYRDPLNPLYSPPSYWEAAPPGGAPQVGPNYFPGGSDPTIEPIQK
jgi:hypothetical protein